MTTRNDDVSELDENADEDAADVIGANELTHHLERIKKFENERRQASERVTEARKEAADAGIDTAALAFILRLSKMEPEEREVYLFRIQKYAALVRYM